MRPSSLFRSGYRGHWPCLVAAGVLYLFASGRWVIPVAAWLAAVFLIRYLRNQPLRRGAFLSWTMFFVTFIVGWRGLVPLPGGWFYVFAAGFSAVLMIPFLLDRWLAPRVGGFAATLVLPCAMVGLEYVTAMTSPYGSWGSLAYSQYGNLPLLQLLSITGLWGVTFLLMWFGTVVNWAWERDFEWPRIERGVAVYGLSLFAVVAFGGARLALAPADSDTLRVASVTARLDQRAGPLTADDLRLGEEGAMPAVGREKLERLEDELFLLSEREILGGAELVFWSEANLPVRRVDEAALIARGASFAREHGAYLVMALATIDPGERLMENKTVTVDPRGEVIATYLKSIPVPGEPAVAGEGELALIDTPYGRIAQAICFDMDFPQLIRQAGRADADILLAPSSDWVEIDPLHTRMATFRAIENGVAVVRQTNQGLSMAVDHQGKVLSEVNYFHSAEHTMVARVPTHGVFTLYSRIGDLFAWLCLAVLVFLQLRVVAASRAVERPVWSGAGSKAA